RACSSAWRCRASCRRACARRRAGAHEPAWRYPEARHGCAGARPNVRGCGGPCRGPPRRLNQAGVIPRGATAAPGRVRRLVGGGGGPTPPRARKEAAGGRGGGARRGGGGGVGGGGGGGARRRPPPRRMNQEPVIAFGQQPCGFFPRRFLVAKIWTARRLQAEI